MQTQIQISRHLAEKLRIGLEIDREEIFETLQSGEQIITDNQYNDGRMLTFKEIKDFRAKHERRFIIVSFRKRQELTTIITAFIGGCGHVTKRGFVL